jgi:hypothetical protein
VPRETDPLLLREPAEEFLETEPELARDVVLPTEERDTLLTPDPELRTEDPAA